MKPGGTERSRAFQMLVQSRGLPHDELRDS